MNPWDKLKKLIEEEEGRIDMVYLDTEGKPTGGVGHLMQQDELDSLGIEGYTTVETIYGPREVGTDKNGTPISLSNEWVNSRLDNDLGIAYEAAKTQLPTNKGVDGMIDRLTAVNFQLGVNWEEKFPGAMESLQDGDAIGFANNLKYKDIDNVDAGFSKYYNQMGGAMNENNRVDKGIVDATRVTKENQDRLDREFIQQSAYKDVSAKVALEWDMVNTLTDLGQVFTPHKKEGKQ